MRVRSLQRIWAFLTPRQIEALNSEAQRQEETRAVIIRRAVTEYLQRRETEERAEVSR
jgi:hypothetical protein